MSSTRNDSCMRAYVIFLIVSHYRSLICQAVIPSVTIQVLPSNNIYYASESIFGPSLPSGRLKDWSSHTFKLSLPPSEDPFLCKEEESYSSTTLDNNSNSNNTIQNSTGHDEILGTIVVVPRGDCTFERKVYRAEQYGAKGVIVYNTLASRYDINTTSNETVWPQNKEDYECSKAQAWIPKNLFSFDPKPYNAEINDLILSSLPSSLILSSTSSTMMSTNQCASLYGLKKFEQDCASRRCLLTGKENTTSNTVQACCAWDLYIPLGKDRTLDETKKTVSIPSVFVTMEVGHAILNEMTMYDSNSMRILMYQRPVPNVNPSSILILFLGIFVVWFSSWLSASEYRNMQRTMKKCVMDGNFIPTMIPSRHFPRNRIATITTVATPMDQSNHSRTNPSQSNSLSPEENPEQGKELQQEEDGEEEEERDTAIPQQDHDEEEQQQQTQSQREQSPRGKCLFTQSKNNELNLSSAAIFLVTSSVGILILYYCKIYYVVKVWYGVGCGFVTTMLIFRPTCKYIFQGTFLRNNLCHSCSFPFCKDKKIRWYDIISIMFAYTLVVVWLWYGFTHTTDLNIKPFYWILQNIYGISFSIVCLRLIRLNSIKVATALLLCAFIYDIFFTFITPFILKDKKSIMVEVANGGAPDDPNFCEKYPRDKSCGGVLPILLTLPYMYDYRHFSSLLGLGDIILPGFLISFAARYDASRNLVQSFLEMTRRQRQRQNHRSVMKRRKCYRLGYFTPLVISYSIGLGLACLMGYVMDSEGQPALLYIVPMCLGTTYCLGWWCQKDLKLIWSEPKSFSQAERIKRILRRFEDTCENENVFRRQ